MNIKVCFIGAGNLATQLSKNLVANGISVSQIYSRTISSAQELASQLGVKYTSTITDIDKSADTYIVALKDSVIDDVLAQYDFNNKLVVHCAGSISIEVLEKHSTNIGVFYPLQTFSKVRDIEFSNIPVLIEANTKSNEDLLINLARLISNQVSILNSEKRKYLHISAVFACNFVNHFYNLSAQILNSKDIDFDVLRPLILETAEKVQTLDPATAQTGPAVRFDENVISSHLKELEGIDNYAELYKSISKSIFEHHKK
jgi:predicted short-subunit dehydrogenase-like oxidoreductase (DUF2520 family)